MIFESIKHEYITIYLIEYCMRYYDCLHLKIFFTKLQKCYVVYSKLLYFFTQLY